MNKYDRLMQEIVEYLFGTWLAQPRGSFADRGPIQGCSEAEIEVAEQSIGRKLPAAMIAWYRVAGRVPPYLNDYDSDFSLRDLMNSQAMTYGLIPTDEWRRPKTMLLFSSRLGEYLWMVDTGIGDPDDPPVFCLGENDTTHRIVESAFSVFMREMWLEWLEWTQKDKREDTFKSKQYSIHIIRQEAKHLRQYLIEDVYEEDCERGSITGPCEFQERWVAEFAASDLEHKFQTEGLRVPFGWIDPPTDE